MRLPLEFIIDVSGSPGENTYFRNLIIIISIILALGFFDIASAIPPEIYSIIPDKGSNLAPTPVTIEGSGFQETPTIYLYGGGPYIKGSYDTPGYANGVYVRGNYDYTKV